MKLSISEIAILSGVSVRTLHYYDDIGLLKPKEVTEAGYRYYDKKSLETLQIILFYKELQFPLKEIKKIITCPQYNKIQALKEQKELLMLKKARLNNIIKLVDSIIKGDDNMSFEEFDVTAIEEAKKKYVKEAEKRYGNTEEYKESRKREGKYNDAEKDKINIEAAVIMKEFANLKDIDPNNEKVQKLVSKWQNHISKYYYKCTKEILSDLGQMYVNDIRFKENIDKNGEGTAQFLSHAIEIYCSK